MPDCQNIDLCAQLSRPLWRRRESAGQYIVRSLTCRLFLAGLDILFAFFLWRFVLVLLFLAFVVATMGTHKQASRHSTRMLANTVSRMIRHMRQMS